MIEEAVGRLSGARLTLSPQRATAALDPFEKSSRMLLDHQAANVIDARCDSEAEYLEFRPELGPTSTLRGKSVEMLCGTL